MPEVFHDDARDGVESFVRPLDTETIVEVGDRRRTAHDELALALFADVLLVFDVELVVDVADDLLDRIFDGDEARDATGKRPQPRQKPRSLPSQR